MPYTESNLHTEQIRRLYAQGAIGLIGTIINGLVVALIVGQGANWKIVSGWFLCLLIVSVVRFIDVKRFPSVFTQKEDSVRWRNRFVVLAFISGIIWGSAGMVMVLFDAAPYYPFIAFVQGGLVAGTVGIYAVYFPAFVAFAVPTLLPTTIFFFILHTPLGVAMGALVFLFLVLMIATAGRLNKSLKKGIELQLEKFTLIDKLKTEIVERKSAQVALEKSKSQVEEKVEVRTAELKSLNNQLNQEIIERKTMALALKENERKFRELVENINDVIYVVDDAGILTFVSPAIERLLGYQPEDLIGQPLGTLVHENDKSIVKCGYSFLSGDEIASLTYRVLSKDGSVRWVRASNRPTIENGRLVQIRGSLSDITETKNLESQLQQAKKMEAIGRVAGGVAHDLNNILSGIVSYPELLLMDLPQDSDLRKPLSTIQKSGIRAAHIVQDLLTLSRRGISVKDVVNLNDVIEEYLSSSEFTVMAQQLPNIQVNKILENDLLCLSGDPVQLSKMIMNLFTNAMEAMPGGGELCVKTSNCYIDYASQNTKYTKEGDYVVLEISDNGIGMSNEVVEKIFEPFFSKKTIGRSGSGLGMTVVWGTVEDHNGRIDVESDEGNGTLFTISFPATRQEPSKSKITPTIDDYTGNGEVVLIVDDIAEQREIGSNFLTKLNYTVSTVSSGEEAVAFLSKNAADIIVLDMIMSPGMDGLDTYREVLKLFPQQKAIFASGFSQTDRVKEAKRLGAGDYVQKPYTLENLGVAIRKELDSKPSD